MKKRWYIGINKGAREAFQATVTPTKQSHGHLYSAVWGPFRTKRGAEFGASWRAVNNPHVQTVADAERIAKSIANL